MNKNDIHNLIAFGEGFTAEFKHTGTLNLIWELCAVANATCRMILPKLMNWEVAV